MRVTWPTTLGLMSRLKWASRAKTNNTSATGTSRTVTLKVSLLPLWRGGGGMGGAAFGWRAIPAGYSAATVAAGTPWVCGVAAQLMTIVAISAHEIARPYFLVFRIRDAFPCCR